MSTRENEKAPEQTPQPALSQKRALEPTSIGSPAKKQSKWTAQEDQKIIELRAAGVKWEDISKSLPGRSAMSCRLRYQNYLERRSEWDEERKNQLARLYERHKSEMWKILEREMKVPWRAIEAMHWKLGEQEMADRAGVKMFSTSSSAALEPPKRKNDSIRKDGASASSGSATRTMSSTSDSAIGNTTSKP